MSGFKTIDQRKGWSERKINSFKKAVAALPDVTAHDDLCIYVTGSFGRLEASVHSDLDLFFIQGSDRGQTQMSHIAKILMDASLITTSRDMGFPEFTGDGEYLKVHHLQDITKNLGGPSDDFENQFTARLLLLPESIPVYNEQLYDNTLAHITGSYFRDYQDHENDFRPTFLVNDILPFWKTLCLNYEHSRNSMADTDIETRKSHLKNLKLKFSRMLTCFSLVIPLAIPRESLEPEECVELVRKRPLERLHAVTIQSNNAELWTRLTDNYSWFLALTGQPRSEILDWVGSSANRAEAFARANCFGKTMNDLLVAVATPETLRYIVI